MQHVRGTDCPVPGFCDRGDEIWVPFKMGDLFTGGTNGSFSRRILSMDLAEYLVGLKGTAIPRLTSDPANEFSANEDFLSSFSDLANEYGFG
jgi:hypothetical protein